MAVKRPGAWAVVAPDGAHQLIAGEHPLGLLSQDAQQPILDGTQLHGALLDGDVALMAVDPHRAGAEHRGRWAGRCASQDCGDPRAHAQFRHS